MVIAKLYRMEPVYSGTHFIVNLSPDQEILSVFSCNYSNCQDRHVCIRQIPLGFPEVFKCCPFQKDNI